jgi:peroxiredoxin
MTKIFNSTKRLVGVFLLVFLVVMTSVWMQNGFAAENVCPQAGRKAPDFTLDSLTAKNVNLYRVIQGNKVTLINFWGMWCPYCVREIPEFVSFYRQYHQRKVEVFAVNVGDNPKDIPSFAKENQMQFPILLDKTNAVNPLYQITGFPTTIIIDQRAKIRDIIVGATNQSVLAAKVDAILREK